MKLLETSECILHGLSPRKHRSVVRYNLRLVHQTIPCFALCHTLAANGAGIVFKVLVANILTIWATFRCAKRLSLVALFLYWRDRASLPAHRNVRAASLTQVRLWGEWAILCAVYILRKVLQLLVVSLIRNGTRCAAVYWGRLETIDSIVLMPLLLLIIGLDCCLISPSLIWFNWVPPLCHNSRLLLRLLV